MLGFPLKLKRLLNALKESEDTTTVLKKSLRKVLVIGSITPPALAKEFANIFSLSDFRSCYGMTEAGGFLTVPPSGEASGTSQGFPIPAIRMKTRKFSASEAEHCLMEHEAVEDVSVTGIPAPDLQDIPAAIVVTRNGYTPDQKLADDLKLHVAALAEEFANTFRLSEFRSCYGMTEAGGFLAVPPSRDASCTNQGFPIPAVRMKVIDTVSGVVLGPMRHGEVLFHTPYAATKYYGDAETSENIVDKDGWIHTGDLGYYDKDGRLFLCGRLKTLLMCEARKFSASEIEHCLMEHEAVEEVSVLGIPSPELQDIPAAVVVTKKATPQIGSSPAT
ncbi:luciferin 4-monooxygenase [Rhipicephalus sanguineus]|uniref:luciferin 4-monooxygenase n=1 Tax=Rhipicephalus sanguineus TaxID=34632 RepID=UPI00189334A5|nr:luciferin 4-monooxygenase [Rhipicephalus sanguineus]